MKGLRLTEQQFAQLRKAKAKPPIPAAAPKVEHDRYPLILRDQIIEAGLPQPYREFSWHPTRNFRADLAWPARKFAVEVDGAVHRIKGKFERDIERHNLLIREGWTYIRVTPAMVKSGEALQWVKEFLS